LNNFLRKQIVDIQCGGINSFFRKFFSLIYYLSEILLTILFFPLFIIIRIISPFILLRFSKLQTARIGHFAVDTHLYILNKIKKRNDNSIDFLYVDYRWICNKELLLFFKKYLNILPKIIVKPLINLNKINFLGNKKHNIDFNSISSSRDTRAVNEIFENENIYEFNASDQKRGEDYLNQLGIKYNQDKFVCIIARDSAYMKSYDTSGNYEYHNYRDVDVNNLILTSEYLTQLGYYVIRMGSVVNKKLTTNNKKIIDYANLSSKNEFLDIFIMKNCEFCISSDTGLYGLAVIFNKPIVFYSIASVACLSYTNNKHIFIFKKYLSKKTGKYLSLSEIFINKLACLDRSEDYELNNIMLIENNAEEIKEVTIELLDMLKNNFTNKPSDIENDRFWRIFRENIPFTIWYNWHRNAIRSKIGREFLKKNYYFYN
jgi:putative glycosyltransferase (TIGR04372 family)